MNRRHIAAEHLLLFSGAKKATVQYQNATLTTDGDYTILTYEMSGQFNLSGGSLEYDVLSVGGGGGGGAGPYGAGGGAGGLVWEQAKLSSPFASDVIIGLGGDGSDTANIKGGMGNDSIFSDITAMGGGGGGSRDDRSGLDGGCGGGVAVAAESIAGIGLQPTSPSGGFGNDGGGNASLSDVGAGGGGADAVGTDALGVGTPSPGGDGRDYSGVFGVGVGDAGWFAGGGGGGKRTTVSEGGRGGGGDGGRLEPFLAPTNGQPNTGGGGGGGGSIDFPDGADGGSGIVIVRIETSKATFQEVA